LNRESDVVEDLQARIALADALEIYAGHVILAGTRSRFGVARPGCPGLAALNQTTGSESSGTARAPATW
jgi:hypothetical protein